MAILAICSKAGRTFLTTCQISHREWPAKAHVRIGWLRSVANIYHAFAIQCFTDELAHAVGRDPLDYLLDLIGNPRTIDFKGVEYPNYVPRWTPILGRPAVCAMLREVVAEKSGWESVSKEREPASDLRRTGAS